MGNKSSKGTPKDSTKDSKPSKSPKRSIKCILLGTACSGKSTFARQLRVIHGVEFTPIELENLRKIIRGNISSGLLELGRIQKAELQEINQKYIRLLETITTEENWNDCWEPKFVEKLKSLWDDEAIQKGWTASTNSNLYNLPYFMQKIDIISDDKYLPSHDDIFRARQRTAGAADVQFVAEKFHWSLQDAGGQPSERKLWPAIFKSGKNHAVMYFAAIDEYDVISPTNPEQTKMEDSLTAWKALFQIPMVKASCILLFLNKVDLFTEKWKKDQTSFNQIFQKAENIDDAIQLIGDRYVKLIPEEFKAPYVVPVIALETSLISTAFQKIKAHVVADVLANAGLFV